MLIPTLDFFRELIAQGLNETGNGPFANLNLHLIAARFTPGPITALADLTEATYTGYAVVPYGHAQFHAFDSAVFGPCAVSNLPGVYAPAAPYTVPNTIYGYVLVDPATSKTIASELFDTPVPMVAPGDQLGIQLELDFSLLTSFGQAIVTA